MLNQFIKEIADLVGVDYLKTIRHTVGHIASVPVALLDVSGAPFSSDKNLYAFQFSMDAEPSLGPKAHGPLCQDPLNRQRPSIVVSPVSGLKSAMLPIVVKEEHVGSWFVSQMRMLPPKNLLSQDVAQLPPALLEPGGESGSLDSCVANSEFDSIVNFLIALTTTIAELGEANVMLNQKNTELLALTKKLDTALNAFKEFVNLTDVGTYLVDYDTGELLLYSNSYLERFGLTRTECLADPCFYHMGYDDFCPFCPKKKLLDENGNPNGPQVWENYNEKFNSWLSVTSRALRWLDGRMVIMTAFWDITKRKQEEERIAYLAYHDQYLDIPNAVKLHEDLKKYNGERVYVLFSDIKSLKDINSVYGRLAGDGLLKVISDWMSAFADENKCVYRIDGDNFAVLFQNTLIQEVEAFALTVFTRFESPWHVDLGGVVQRIYAGIQLGITRIETPIDDNFSLLNLAEKVLLFAKNANKSIIFDEEMDKKYQLHTQLSVSLKGCVLNGMEGFSVHYQPVVDVETEQWIGVEALCRWTAPDGTQVPPTVFIDEAEKLGIVILIDNWVMQRAICQMKELGLDRLPNFTLSVNLSPIQLRDKELASFVLRSLEKYDYPVDKFSLEIIETMEVQFDELTCRLLSELQDAGIKLTLDDFGTGYATFSNLKNLPVNVLKTDRSFITGIEEDVYLQQTMNIMTQFAHLAGLNVTVEGVETPAQYEVIKKNGANHIQGFYFSKPLPLEELAHNLDNFNL